jgi:hypothetical protein
VKLCSSLGYGSIDTFSILSKMKSFAKSGEPTSLAKRLRVLGKDIPISTTSTKRASMGANNVKIGKDNARNAIGNYEFYLVRLLSFL